MPSEMKTLLGDIHQTLQDFISLQKDIRKDDMGSAAARLSVSLIRSTIWSGSRGARMSCSVTCCGSFVPRVCSVHLSWDDSGSDGPARRLLWIKGHAGTGRRCSRSASSASSHVALRSAPALCFFFCQGTDTALDNATAVLRSSIWLLLLQQPCLMSHLLQKYKESETDLFRDRNAFYALSEAFSRDIVEVMPRRHVPCTSRSTHLMSVRRDGRTSLSPFCSKAFSLLSEGEMAARSWPASGCSAER